MHTVKPVTVAESTCKWYHQPVAQFTHVHHTKTCENIFKFADFGWCLAM